jgi:hypothetical protein
MFNSRCMQFRRCAVVLGAAAIFAAASVGAQTPVSPNESTSSAFLIAPGDGFGDGAAMSAASSAGGSGAAAGGAQAGSWKHGIFSNFAAELGGGFNAPIGNDNPFITWGGNVNVGGGVHLSKRFSLLAEYQFMDNKLPGGLIADVGAQGGHAHIWSLTLDPVVDLFPARINSVYLTGGGGFYRKVTSFTDPELVEECYYFCGIGTENVVVSHFSSNQGGLNFGMGITHRLGGINGNGKTKLFAEARYLFLNTPGINETDGLGTTELIPVTFGIRW